VILAKEKSRSRAADMAGIDNISSAILER
jgi:hypothetical protein